MPKDWLIIGKALRVTRERHKLSQTYVAKASEMSQALLSKVESGKIEPRFTTAVRICRVLNLNPRVITELV